MQFLPKLCIAVHLLWSCCGIYGCNSVATVQVYVRFWILTVEWFIDWAEALLVVLCVILHLSRCCTLFVVIYCVWGSLRHEAVMWFDHLKVNPQTAVVSIISHYWHFSSVKIFIQQSVWPLEYHIRVKSSYCVTCCLDSLLNNIA